MAFNVLVVDDSAVMRGIIIKTLRLSGLELNEIHQAGNGQEGLAMIDRNWIDLALVDINMPLMNGEEMINRLRANPQTESLPIIVVSTEGSETRIKTFQEHGVKFMHKPFDPVALRAMIREMTGVSDEQGFAGQPVSSGDFDF